MNRKYILVTFAVASMLLLAGCAEFQDSGPSGDDLAEDTGEDVSGVTVGESYQYEIKLTEKNQYGLVQAHPPFQMDNSLERENLIRRYQYLNDRNNVHHVYLMSENGQVVSYYTAQGKVSSVNSKLTNDQQIVASNQCLETENDGSDDAANCYFSVESPQMDGSYGENGDGIFFFTTDGHYVEWNGIYLVSEEPKNIQTEVMLVDQVDDDGNNVSDSDTNSTDTNKTDESS